MACAACTVCVREKDGEGKSSGVTKGVDPDPEESQGPPGLGRPKESDQTARNRSAGHLH